MACQFAAEAAASAPDFAVEGAGWVGLFSFCADALVRTTMLPARKTTSSMRFELGCNLLTIYLPLSTSVNRMLPAKFSASSIRLRLRPAITESQSQRAGP